MIINGSHSSEMTNVSGEFKSDHGAESTLPPTTYHPSFHGQTELPTHSSDDCHPATERSHAHTHNPESLKQIINRLSRIEGHIRGVKNMVQDNQPCPDVLIQIAAVRGALNRVARMILDAHLSDCIARAAETGTIESEIAELKSALDRFLP
jgi:DNA-binding FrmR family transcriptional regulator